MKKFFEELSRRLREGGVESSNVEDRRLEIFLHGQPVLFVSPGNDVFLFPAGSNNPEASELYHRVAQTADEVYTYVEEVQTAPTLHISGLSEKFHLLADFGGAVLAGRELENGRGYQFVTWIWDYNRTGVSYGHYYDEDFCGAKQDFAVRSGLISKTQLFSPEELTELYRATDYLLASKERLWQPALPALSHDSIDFSRIVSKPHGFAIQDYPIFYSARRLYDLKSPMEAEDLAHPKLVSDLDFHNIIYATMIARYGKAVMDASKEAPEWAMC